MRLEKGKKYNVSEMLGRFLCWYSSDGNTDGYLVDCYFDPEGTYLGADADGIEPVFAD